MKLLPGLWRRKISPYEMIVGSAGLTSWKSLCSAAASLNYEMGSVVKDFGIIMRIAEASSDGEGNAFVTGKLAPSLFFSFFFSSQSSKEKHKGGGEGKCKVASPTPTRRCLSLF